MVSEEDHARKQVPCVLSGVWSVGGASGSELALARDGFLNLLPGTPDPLASKWGVQHNDLDALCVRAACICRTEQRAARAVRDGVTPPPPARASATPST